jgi:hypothetical protein
MAVRGARALRVVLATPVVLVGAVTQAILAWVAMPSMVVVVESEGLQVLAEPEVWS